jgi:hypothetical protein
MRLLGPTLFENMEWKGIWWLPGSEDTQVPGTLKYEIGKSITLELIGSLIDRPDPFKVENLRLEIIHGFTEDSQPITLHKNFETRINIASSGLVKSAFISKYVFIGKHFQSPEAITFSSMESNFTDLEEWMCQYPFEFIWGGKNSDKRTVSYSFPPRHDVFVKCLNSKIETNHHFSSSGNGFRRVEWTHTSFLKIAPIKKEESFEWYLKTIIGLQNLLSLFIGEPIYPKIIIGSGDSRELRPGLKIPETINVLFRQHRPEARENIHPLEMVIILPMIISELQDILCKWFEKSEALNSVFDLYFGTLYNPDMYFHSQFLNLIQAVESYHRVTIGGKYISDVDWKPYCQALGNSIPAELSPEHKESLLSRIKYGNEYSLRKRIRDLLKGLESSTVDELSPSKNYFTGKIVETRHYLTHYDECLKNKALAGLDLYYANKRLRALLTILLLREIGLKEKTILDQIRKIELFRDVIKAKLIPPSPPVGNESETQE